MREFIKYFFERPLRDDGKGRMWFTLNYSWTFGSILFIILFLIGVRKYEAPIFYFFALIPFLMLVYNIIDEYNAFLFKKNGFINISARRLMVIFYGLCFIIFFALIGILILNEMKII